MVLLTTRAGKGSPLTNTEMDANLTALNGGFDNIADIAERVAIADPTANAAQRAGTVARGVENRPAASAGKSYFRVGVLASASLSGVASFTRLTVATAPDQAGLLQSFASGSARVNSAGYLSEETRTNKCTNTNLNPASLAGVTLSGDAAATLTLVDDSVALAAIGLTGNVYKLDNSAGTTSAFASIAGTTGNTNNHISSVYVRSTGAGGVPNFVGFSTSSAPGVTTFGAVAAYQRVSALTITPATTLQAFVRAGAGYIVYFILNDLEEGGFVTSPKQVNGATATRNADVAVETVSIPVGQAFTITGKLIAPPVAASSPVVFELLSAANANDRLMLFCSGGGARLLTSSAGMASADPFGGVTSATTAGAPVGFAISVAGSVVTWSVNGGPANVANLPGGAYSQALTRLALACRVIGTQQLNSTLRECNIVMRAMSAAEVQTASDVSLERDLDFTTQTYQFIGEKFDAITELPGTTFSRAGTARTLTVAGALLAHASGAIRTTDAGLTVEGAVTNKCQNANLNPAALTNVSITTNAPNGLATLTLVDDSANLGPLGLSGNVYKIDNSAGDGPATVTIIGQAGNTNPHTHSIRAGGSGTFFCGSNSATWTQKNLGASYARFSDTHAPSSALSQLSVRANAGAAVFFILNQFEELGFATSDIVTPAGATASRSADILADAVAPSAGFSIFAEFTIPNDGNATNPRVWEWGDGQTNNLINLCYQLAGNSVRLQVRSAGGAYNSIAIGTAAPGATVRVAAAFANNDFAASLNGGAVVTSALFPIPAGLNILQIGSFGPTAGSFWGPGIRKIKRWRGRRTNAQLIADAT